jgi:hypothetical protein
VQLGCLKLIQRLLARVQLTNQVREIKKIELGPWDFFFIFFSVYTLGSGWVQERSNFVLRVTEM